MVVYLHGRIKGNRTVHLFREVGKAGEVTGAGVIARSEAGLEAMVKRVVRTPICGSGNTHNVNGRVMNKVALTGDEVTCAKCKAMIEGGG